MPVCASVGVNLTLLMPEEEMLEVDFNPLAASSVGDGQMQIVKRRGLAHLLILDFRGCLFHLCSKYYVSSVTC